jgi:hypothetical protein
MKYSLIFLIGFALSLKLNHVDYAVELTIGNTTQKLKLDTTRGASVIKYDGMNTGITSTLDKANIEIDGHNITYSYVQGKDNTLGLGYKNQYGTEYSLLSVLKSNGLTAGKQFTIDNDSIDFDSQVAPNDWCKLMKADDLDDRYKEGWLCDLTHILVINGNNTHSQIELDARVLFDYRSAQIKVPKSFYNYIIDNFNGEDYLCEEKLAGNDTIVTCSAQHSGENVYLALGDHAYRLSNPYNSTHSELNIRFTDDEKVWVLGKPFLKGYTLTFDAENGQVGITGGEERAFSPNTWWTKIVDKARKYFYLVIISTIVICFILILVICLIVRSMRRKRLEEHGPLINERV